MLVITFFKFLGCKYSNNLFLIFHEFFVKVEETGMSENCLYLSIWSSDLKRKNLTSVIVILSSGEEDTSDSNGVELADVGDVVVVIIESRHGALGFLAAEDMVVSGIFIFHKFQNYNSLLQLILDFLIKHWP